MKTPLEKPAGFIFLTDLPVKPEDDKDDVG